MPFDANTTMMNLDELQQARAKALRNLTPIQRAEEKINFCLVWLYRWGFSSPSILNQVAGAVQPICPRLHALGLIKKNRLAAAGIAGRPSYLVTLTPDGLAAASRVCEDNLQYKPSIRETQIRHDLFAQIIALTLSRSGQIRSYIPARLLEGHNSSVPDVLAVAGTAEQPALLFIEVELFKKLGNNLVTFSTKIYRHLTKNPRNIALIATDSHAVAAHYRKAFSPNTTRHIALPHGDKPGPRQKEEAFTITPELANRILIKII